jgi:hypothetical protein
MQNGMKEEKAREMLIRYLKLSVETPIPQGDRDFFRRKQNSPKSECLPRAMMRFATS